MTDTTSPNISLNIMKNRMLCMTKTDWTHQLNHSESLKWDIEIY